MLRKCFNKSMNTIIGQKCLKTYEGMQKLAMIVKGEGGLQQNNILHLILAKASFQRIEIDIVGSLTITWQGNQYIVTAIDYFTKWPIAEVLKEATAKAVSSFIYRKIICEHGYPEILQSDRGTYFVNRVI